MRMIHASCVAIGGAGLLLRGPTGAGKSDLALRLIEHGAELVADDQVALAVEGGGLIARSPARLAGLLEARGLGILTLPRLPSARVALLCHLVPREEVARLPEEAFEVLLGVRLPRLTLHAFDATTPVKLRLALVGLAATTGGSRQAGGGR